VSTSVTNINNTIDEITPFIDFLETALNTLSVFITKPTDGLLTNLQAYLTIFKQISKSINAFGASAILIHPWNRVNQQQTALTVGEAPKPITTAPRLHSSQTLKLTLGPDIGMDMFKISYTDGTVVNTPKEQNTQDKPDPFVINTMSPREAFQELFTAMRNNADPNSPKWTADTQVTGFGFLIAVPDPKQYYALINVLMSFFTLPDFSDIVNKYNSDLIGYTQDQYNKQSESLVKTFQSPFTVQSGSTLSSFSLENGFSYTEDGQYFGGPRWYGIHVSDFPVIKNTVDWLFNLADSLLQLTKNAEDIIALAIKVIIKKLDQIKSLFDQVKTLNTTIANNLTNGGLGGLYSFTIPNNIPPESGGVDYIQQAIENGINDPANPIYSTLDSCQFSTIAFIGTSIGFDFDLWGQWFTDAWKPIPNPIIDIKQIVVSPNFSASIGTTPTTPIYFGIPYTLTVSYPIQNTNYLSLLYTYEIKNPSNTVIFKSDSNIASFDSFDKTYQVLKGNNKMFTVNAPGDIITFPSGVVDQYNMVSGTYNISIGIYDPTGLIKLTTYDQTFNIYAKTFNIYAKTSLSGTFSSSLRKLNSATVPSTTSSARSNKINLPANPDNWSARAIVDANIPSSLTFPALGTISVVDTITNTTTTFSTPKDLPVTSGHTYSIYSLSNGSSTLLKTIEIVSQVSSTNSFVGLTPC